MATIQIQVEPASWDAVKAALKDAGPLAQQALAAALYKEMNVIIGDAKSRTPVDTGVLRASGVALPPVTAGNLTTVVGGFGGAAAAYSIPVHERLGVQHTVGEAKFLENAVNETAPLLGQKVAKDVGTALSRLRGA